MSRGSYLRDDFDSMQEHFNETNSYVTSSGDQVKYDRKRASSGNNTKLHVTMIPLSLTEKGLMHIFASEGGSPTKSYIGKSNKPNDFNWGFVEFSTHGEAQAAISAVHKKPPHNLHVKFARTEEEKLELEKNKGDDSDSDRFSTISRMSSAHMVRGRGLLPPMQGKPPSSYRATGGKDEPFYDDPKQQDYSSNKFSHPSSSHEISSSNAVYSPFAEGVYDDGQRKISMGRGTYINHVERGGSNHESQRSFHSSSPNVSRDKFVYEEISDEMDFKVAAYISKRFRELSCDENFKFSSEMKLSMPFKLGQCAYCARPSIYCCSRCKTWYCCNSCRNDDYKQHKMFCFPRTMNFDKDGNVSYVDKPDVFADAEEIPSLMNYPSGRANHAQKDQSLGFPSPPKNINNSFGYPSESNGFDHGSDLADNRSRENTNRGNQRNRPQERDRNEERDWAQERNRNQERDRPLEKARHQDKDRELQRPKGGPKGYVDNNDQNRFRNNNKFNGGGARNDRRGGRGNQNTENGEVYVRPPISPPESISSRFQEKLKTPQTLIDHPPIPRDKFTEVTIGSFGKNNEEFFAFSELEYEFQMEVMKTLVEVCPSGSPISGRLELSDRVAAPYDNGWYRATVKKISGSLVDVFFMDFGNEATIEKSKLRVLPPEFVNKPNTVHKYILADSPENPVLKEESAIMIKPIHQDMEGRWVVQVEGVKYEEPSHPKGDEVTEESICGGLSGNLNVKHLLFTLDVKKTAKLRVEKVMNEDFLTGCIIPEGTTLHFEEVANILKKEIVKTDIVGLNKGMMVAAFWDNNWHRGYVMLIRDRDPIVALIDRGRVVIPQAVAPLPTNINIIPESGIRAIFKNPIQDMNMTGKILFIKNARVDENKAYVDVESLGEGVLVPWEPAVEEAGLSSVRLSSGSKVLISSYVSPTSIYVQSNKKEDIVLRAELMQDIAAHCMNCEPLKRKPLCGEFLAVRFIEDNNYYRAQIFRRHENKYKVTFVDYGNTETVSIAEMKPLPDSIKSIPCCAVKVGLKGVPDVPFNVHCMKYLNHLSVNLMELFLDYDGGDMGNSTLQTGGGEILNKVLADFLAPSWVQPDFNPSKGEPYMDVDLVYEEWKKGETFQFSTVRVVHPDKIIVVRTSTDLLHHIESNLTPLITKYCEQYPQEIYNPRPSEICLAKFHEDGKWYRAVCLKKSTSHNSSEMYYIDYGNYGEVLHRCIRKMVQDFMATPVALKICKVYGIPPKLPDETKEKLIHFYTSNNLEGKILDEKAGRPILWIPALKPLAEKLGFKLKCPY